MNQERKHHKINTTTFDNIKEDNLESLLDKISEDLTKIQDNLMKKAVMKLIDDYRSLDRRFWIYLIIQFIINILLCIGINLK